MEAVQNLTPLRKEQGATETTPRAWPLFLTRQKENIDGRQRTDGITKLLDRRDEGVIVFKSASLTATMPQNPQDWDQLGRNTYLLGRGKDVSVGLMQGLPNCNLELRLSLRDHRQPTFINYLSGREPSALQCLRLFRPVPLAFTRQRRGSQKAPSPAITV